MSETNNVSVGSSRILLGDLKVVLPSEQRPAHESQAKIAAARADIKQLQAYIDAVEQQDAADAESCNHARFAPVAPITAEPSADGAGFINLKQSVSCLDCGTFITDSCPVCQHRPIEMTKGPDCEFRLPNGGINDWAIERAQAIYGSALERFSDNGGSTYTPAGVLLYHYLSFALVERSCPNCGTRVFDLDLVPYGSVDY